ncbi:hypothetical protein [Sediminicola luteus]|uniref:DUF4386 domain-containing protein n=1 Tax=Sediminicola luteus TaxID=319238 RepID=A0A2A4GCY0_9FLAO|nr:hypothetical protein [Sediminicola luteus]PCE66313.1 hypothetical protein B7P33_03170 [Sediminicola luteus]
MKATERIRLGAWGCFTAYVVGITLYLFAFGEAQPLDLDMILTQRPLYESWITIIYIGFGLALVLLNHGLKQGVSEDQVFYPLGNIWATMVLASGFILLVGLDKTAQMTDPEQAQQHWVSLSLIQDALGGGIELLAGLYTLLVSRSLYKIGVFSRWKTAWGYVVGALGILSLFSPLRTSVLAFGLGQLLWFLLLGLPKFNLKISNP